MVGRPTASQLRGRTVQRPWGRLRIWQAGDGPVLLALHGLGGSGRYWGGLAAAVAGRFTVVAPDHGGFGHSDKPALDYNRSFHLDNLDAVVEEVDQGHPIVVVGHSLGGVMAAVWAARHPERIRALALVAAPFPEPGREMPSRDRQTHDQDQRQSRQRLYSAFQSTWPVITLPLRSRVYPRAVVADYMLHTLPSYWGTGGAFLWDATAAAELVGLREIDGRPALILTAIDDRRVLREDAGRWAQLIPGAQRLEVTGGHQLLLRSRFLDLAGWLRQLP